jgi:hypothetical protein
MLCTPTQPVVGAVFVLYVVCCMNNQALKHYGESVRLGHKAILQSLPRLLTLYFEFGSKVAATKALNQKLRTAQTQVGQVEPKGLGVEIGFENKGFERIACCGLHP